jgi:hypothetical protein
MIDKKLYQALDQLTKTTVDEFGYYPAAAVPEVIKSVNDAFKEKILNESITPEEQNFLDIINSDADLSDAFVEGATYGFSAELQKNFSSLPPVFAEAFQEHKLEELYKTKPYRAGGTEIAGSIVPLLVGKGAARKIFSGGARPITTGTQPKRPVMLKILENVRQSPKTQSAVFGYTYGLGKTEGPIEERVKKFQPYATALTALGTNMVFGGLANVVSELSDAFVSSSDPHVARDVGRRFVLRALASDKENIDEALKEAYTSLSQNVGETSATNKQLTLADMGSNTKASMDFVNSLPGRGRAIVQKFLRNRSEGRLDRLTTDLRQAFGSDADFYEELGSLVETRKANGIENYKKAYVKTFDDGSTMPRMIATDAIFETEMTDLTSGSKEIKQYTLEDLFQAPVMQDAVEDAVRLAANDERNFPVTLKKDGTLVFTQGDFKGEKADGTSLRFLHYVKMSLDDKLFNEKYSATKSLGRTEVAQIGRLRKNLLNVMDTIPDYRKARKIFAGDMALQEAMMDGLNVFKPSSEMPQIFMEGFENSEKEAYRLGVMQAVIKQLEDGVNGSDLAKRIFKNETRNKLLRQTFPEGKAGDKIFNTFKDNFTNEMITRATEVQVQGNSSSLQRQNFKELAESMLGASSKLSKIKNPKLLFGTALGFDFPKLDQEQLAVMGEKIAEILTETDARKLEILLKKGRPFGDAILEVAPTIIPRMLSVFAKLPNNPYAISDFSSIVLDQADDEIEQLGDQTLQTLKDSIKNASQNVSNENAQVIRKDNFQRTVPSSVASEVMPKERQRVGEQLDQMLASFQPSNIPLVPPANAIRPQDMINETILPNPKDRELAERQMMRSSGIGSLA